MGADETRVGAGVGVGLWTGSLRSWVRCRDLSWGWRGRSNEVCFGCVKDVPGLG